MADTKLSNIATHTSLSDTTRFYSVNGTTTGYSLGSDLITYVNSGASFVPTTRTVNGHALSADVTISATDLSLGNVENTALSTWAGSTSITTLGTISSGTVPVANVSGLASIATSGDSADASVDNTGLTYVTGTTVQAALSELDAALGSLSGGGLTAVVDDTSPQLGGDLDLNGHVITGMVIGTDIQAFGSYALQSTTVNGHALSSNVTISASDLTTGTLAAARGGAGTVSGILKANGSGTVSGATAGTDYSAGTSGLSTGILKSTTTTGALTIAVAGDFPTLNQDTTGNAATATKLATARAINGVSFDGTAAITVTADASTLSGTTLKSTVINSSLTSVGTLGILTVTGNITNSALTASQLVATDASKNLQTLAVATYPSLTEISYVKGVTSAIQTQISAKIGGSTGATDNRLIRSDGTGGVTVQSTGITVSDNDEISGFRAQVVTESTTSRTLAATDTGTTIRTTNGSATTITLPNNLTVGFTVEVIQGGAGQVSFSAASGATINNRQSQTKTYGQYSAVRLVVVSNSDGSSAVYNLAGDTGA